MFQARSLEKFEATPLVVDGVLYTVQAPERRGRAGCRHRPRFLDLSPTRRRRDARPCCGRVNRGLAILGDTLFMGTIDAHLIAIDAKSGKPLWNIAVAKAEAGYAHHARSAGGQGQSDRRHGGRRVRHSRLHRRLRCHAPARRPGDSTPFPAPGEPGHETWAGDSWKHGGASVWVTGSYDPALNLTYWGIGNPGPDWNGDQRAGDNLYSDSVVALDADTGKLKWYFQFTPHDEFDYDSVQVPVLADMDWQGAAAQSNAVGQSQRLLSTCWIAPPGKFLTGQAVHQGELGQGLRRKRPSDARARQGADRRKAR